MDSIPSLLGLALRAGRLAVGEEPVGVACRCHKGYLLLLASDAADNTIRRALHFCQAGKTICLTLPLTKQELGSGLGRASCAMLALMDSIASDDRAATPRLLYRETGVLGLPAAIPAKEKRAAVFTAETRQTLRDMMAHNVQETYGQSRFGDLAVCAKSGTAEVSDGAPHAWFVGFVDDSTLPLAFVVVVEHGGSGSDVAGSVAAQLLEQAQS